MNLKVNLAIFQLIVVIKYLIPFYEEENILGALGEDGKNVFDIACYNQRRFELTKSALQTNRQIKEALKPFFRDY